MIFLSKMSTRLMVVIQVRVVLNKRFMQTEIIVMLASLMEMIQVVRLETMTMEKPTNYRPRCTGSGITSVKSNLFFSSSLYRTTMAGLLSAIIFLQLEKAIMNFRGNLTMLKAS